MKPILFSSLVSVLVAAAGSLAQAAAKCEAGFSVRDFTGEAGESVQLCQKTGSAKEPDLLVSPGCKGECKALELRKQAFGRCKEILRRISAGEFDRGRNPNHVLCTEGGGSLVYLALVETGSQLVVCKLGDRSLIAVDSLVRP